jgi:hypothetical protein
MQITTTRGMVDIIDAFAKTGFYGNTRAAAAERLMGEGARAGMREGIIQKRDRIFKQP